MSPICDARSAKGVPGHAEKRNEATFSESRGVLRDRAAGSIHFRAYRRRRHVFDARIGEVHSGGGYEYVLLIGAVCLVIAIRGGGPYSVDRLIGKEL
jgi:hypothetical protein